MKASKFRGWQHPGGSPHPGPNIWGLVAHDRLTLVSLVAQRGPTPLRVCFADLGSAVPEIKIFAQGPLNADPAAV